MNKEDILNRIQEIQNRIEKMQQIIDDLEHNYTITKKPKRDYSNSNIITIKKISKG